MNEEIERLLEQKTKIIKAGNELMDRALYTTREFDGLHRLGSSIANWIDTISKLNKNKKDCYNCNPEKFKNIQKGELEDHNFKVNSDGWKKIIVDDVEYLENREGDIWEILENEARGEQLFTWKSAMRETKRVDKRIPTDDEFTELLKTTEDMPNLVLSGYRNTNGAFSNSGTYTYFWSSSVSGANACIRYLNSSYSTVNRHPNDQAYGFSVRCIKN